LVIRILVVDDSAFMRKILSDILGSDPELSVVGTAKDGNDALKRFRQLAPDIVTLDLNLPDMAGLDVLRQMLREKPVPVLVISAYAGSDAAVEAVAAGAVDIIPKPSGEISLDMAKQKSLMIGKIKEVAKAKIKTFEVQKPRSQSFSPTLSKVVVIGSSTGGPKTLEALLVSLPRNIPAPILIVQHMPPGFTKSLAERFSKICEIEVREAVDGEAVQKGVALIAPGDYHMELVSREGKVYVRLNQEPRELGVRPNVNRLFKSAAAIYGQNTIGIVLTGMGTDGRDGSADIKSMHGTVIAESEETCIIYGMPKAVVDSGLADEVLPLDKIPVALLQLVEI